MHWNEHYNLEGKHAFIGASQHSWLNYTPEKLEQVYLSALKKQKGTELHLFVSMAIKNRLKMAPLKKAINQFVNDAIGFGMRSEQILYYSDNCFGTADAILFKDGLLRIHDLKTGEVPVKKQGQLDIYAALFCLEYGLDPYKINFVTRVYQGREVREEIPTSEDIMGIMNKIKQFNVILDKLEEENMEE